MITNRIKVVFHTKSVASQLGIIILSTSSLICLYFFVSIASNRAVFSTLAHEQLSSCDRYANKFLFSTKWLGCLVCLARW